jgi:hypothetical protein
MIDIKRKVAAITGASSGIGEDRTIIGDVLISNAGLSRYRRLIN